MRFVGGFIAGRAKVLRSAYARSRREVALIRPGATPKLGLVSKI